MTSNTMKSLSKGILLAASYFACGKLSLLMALPNGYASPIFPPAGIAIAAALLSGWRALPWIFLGAFLLNFHPGLPQSRDLLSPEMLIALSSTLQAGIGGWALRKTVGYPACLDNASDLLKFLAIAPIVCLISATLSVSGLFLLGVLDRSTFLTNWSFWWAGDVLGVLVMLPIVMTLAAQPAALWKSRRYTVAIPMLLMFGLIVLIFVRAHRWEYVDSLLEFRQMSQQTSDLVQARLEEQESLLEQMASLFTMPGKITQNEFDRFVSKPLKRFPMIQALEWAPRVDRAERKAFEASRGFPIRQRNRSGKMVRAAIRQEYYPVTYLYPMAGNEPALGYDLASDAARRNAIAGAIARGSTIASAPVHLVQDRQNQYGVLLLFSVEHRENGVVLTVLRMGDFMEKLRPFARGILNDRLIDLDANRVIYDNFPRGSSTPLFREAFRFGSRHYLLETAPTKAYFRQHLRWESWSALAAGIFGTGLLGALLLIGTGHAARIEARVSERTRELGQSEARFRTVVDNVKEVIFQTDAEGTWTFLNHAWEEITGFDVGNSIGKPFLEFVHPEDRQRNATQFAPLIAREKDYCRHEIRYLTREGGFRWIEVYARLGLDESGAIIGTYGTLMDITERKNASNRLRESESNLRMILANSPEGVLAIDSENRISFCNSRLASMLSLEMDEEGKIRMPDFVRQFDAKLEDKSAHALRDMIARKSRQGMFELVDPKRMIRWEAREIRSEELRNILFFRDVTLEVEVDRMKSDFLATAAHELRTPLSSVYGFTELMLNRQIGPQEQREFLTIVYEQAGSLIGMLDELLDLARIEARAGKDFRFAVQDVLAVAKKAANEISMPGDGRKVRMISEFPETPPISIDSDKIRQVFNNVLGNAYKYSPGGGEILMQCKMFEDREGKWLSFQVRDHGIGMTQEQLSHIFEKFYRADTVSGIPGSGLGMSLVLEIMKIHGGKIFVESAPGSGTTVTLLFPAPLQTEP